MTPEVIIPTLLRVIVGILFVLHGADKLKTLPEFTAWMQHLKLPFPWLQARLAAYGEVIGGLALALGLAGPLPEVLLGIIMLVAVRLVHWTRNWSAQKGGWEYNAVLGAVLATFAALGDGPLSADRLLAISFNWQPLIDAIWNVGLTGTGV